MQKTDQWEGKRANVPKIMTWSQAEWKNKGGEGGVGEQNDENVDS